MITHSSTATHRHRVVGVGFALLAALTLALGLVGPVQAATTYKVTGTVTDADGYPLANMDVTLSSHPADEDEAKVVTTRTDSGGRYTFKAAPATTEKDYSLSAADPTGRYVERYAPSFALTRNTTRDLALGAAGFVQGQVSTKDGSAAARPGSTVRVIALSDDDAAFADAKVSANGRFRLTGLPAGTYAVRFQDTSHTFEGLCYDDVPWPPSSDSETCATTTPVVVKAGRTTTLKPQVLDHRLGVITGTVTDTKGAGIARTLVSAFGDDPGDLLAQARTDSSGAFVLKGVRAGTFRLEAFPWEIDRYRERWYVNAGSFVRAKVLTMQDGGTVADLRITLPDAG